MIRRQEYLDVDRVVRRARELELLSVLALPRYEYNSVPLAAIDAVWSIGVRYQTVQRVMARYRTVAGTLYPNALSGEGSNRLLPRTQQHSVSEALDVLGETGGRAADRVFRNRQRTSSRGGVLKAEAVERFLVALKDGGVEHTQDVRRGLPMARATILGIPGQRSGISLDYFAMLTGDESRVKADRWLRRKLGAWLGRQISAGECVELIRAASDVLVEDFPGLTARRLDHAIWEASDALPQLNA